MKSLNKIYKRLEKTKKDFGYDFLLFHNTYANNLLIEKVLSDGVLKMGSELLIDERRMSGGESQPYIFTLIEFADIENLEHKYGAPTFIISPEILYDATAYFNNNWLSYVDDKSIVINKDDEIIHKKDKIKIIYNYLKYQKDHKEEKIASGKMYSPYETHELLISKNIDIKKYIVGVICFDKNVDNIQKIIGDKKYGIKILFHEANIVVTRNTIGI